MGFAACLIYLEVCNCYKRNTNTARMGDPKLDTRNGKFTAEIVISGKMFLFSHRSRFESRYNRS